MNDRRGQEIVPGARFPEPVKFPPPPPPAARGASDELLSEAEHWAMSLTAELYNHLVREVVGDGPTRDADITELTASIHVLQERILAQAAARAYPDRYRLLGYTLRPDHA